MGLTLKVQQDLEDVGLVKFFETDREMWTVLAREAFEYTRRSYTDSPQVRPDDVAQALSPVLARHKILRDFLKRKKIRGKHWITDFCDLVLERTWIEIQPKKV